MPAEEIESAIAEAVQAVRADRFPASPPVRIILDTNILVSALIVPAGAPDYLYQCWRAGRFMLISSEDHCQGMLDPERTAGSLPGFPVFPVPLA